MFAILMNKRRITEAIEGIMAEMLRNGVHEIKIQTGYGTHVQFFECVK